MRIAISGASSVGKSTLLKAFLRKWPMYETPPMTLREFQKEQNLQHSKMTSEETQLRILDWMMLEQAKYDKDSKVIFDRCVWDCLAYTLQANANNLVSDEIAAATISFVKESLKNLDIIFWLKHDSNIRVVRDGVRETDLKFIKETDQVFHDLFDQYSDALESDVFYPKEDSPAIIVVEGLTLDDRVGWISEFLDYKGDLIETTQSILDPENEELLQQLLKDQQDQIGNEAQMKKLINQINTFKL